MGRINEIEKVTALETLNDERMRLVINYQVNNPVTVRGLLLGVFVGKDETFTIQYVPLD
uniref:Uncharacterized protein n=1 Tax=viral metagenome TaxID=1070528 RepID=A0A6M3JSI2_9ZZZZ